MKRYVIQHKIHKNLFRRLVVDSMLWDESICNIYMTKTDANLDCPQDGIVVPITIG